MQSKSVPENLKSKSHPIFFKGLFLIDEQIPPTDNRLYGLRTVTSGIEAPRYLNIPATDISVNLVANTQAEMMPVLEYHYFLSGRFMGLNELATPNLFFLPEGRIKVCKAEDFCGSPESNVLFTSFGIISKRSMVTKVRFDGKQTVVATVQHQDYDPKEKMMRSFTADYLCRPTSYLIKAQSLFQEQRKFVIDSNFVGFDATKKTFVFNVLSVSLSTGVLPQSAFQSVAASAEKKGARGKRQRLEDIEQVGGAGRVLDLDLQAPTEDSSNVNKGSALAPVIQNEAIRKASNAVLSSDM